jgi:hypothetical protein
MSGKGSAFSKDMVCCHWEFLAQNQLQLTASTSTLAQYVGALRKDLVELTHILQQHILTTETRFQMVAQQFQAVAEGFQTVA